MNFASLPVRRFNSSRSLIYQSARNLSLHQSSMIAQKQQDEEEMITEFIDKNLAHGKVTIWTKGDDCQKSGKLSKKAKKLLTKNNIEFEEKTVVNSGKQSQQMVSYYLLMHTGYGNFPNIYFGEEHVGGLDDLKAYLMDRPTTDRVMGDNGIVLTTTSDEEATCSSEGEPSDILFEGGPIHQW